jgi:translation initiation factor 3 subunit D
MVKQLRCNLRDNSVDVKPEWVLIKELTKQTFDRLPMLRPVFMQNIKECGEISGYNHTWDKSTGKKPKPLKNFEGHTFEESLFDDPVMVELIEQNVADIYTTDVVAAVLMCATKSNYSWDVEIKKFDDKIFIDKRQDDPENNILNF